MKFHAKLETDEQLERPIEPYDPLCDYCDICFCSWFFVDDECTCPCHGDEPDFADDDDEW